jgi:small subunit ribosomal protein S1
MRMEDVFEGEQQVESSEMLGVMDKAQIAEVSSQEIVKGKVTDVSKEFVTVDIGFKSEGRIPVAEFTAANGDINVKVGDEVELYVVTLDSRSGDIILSKAQADMLSAWERIEAAYKDRTPVAGIVMATVRAGLMVELGGIRAFMHASQADTEYLANLEDLVGKDVAVRILSYDKEKANITVSRKVIMEEEKQKRRAKILPLVQVGATFDGTVKRISDFGIFVDIGGVDGLVHVSDLSWGRIKHPSEAVSVGDKIKVQVLKYDTSSDKISLGVKQLSKDPWDGLSKRYSAGDKVKGKIVSLTDYGAFLEIEPGVDGMIHISEMSWNGKIRKPSQLLKLGDVAEVAILEIDPTKKKISLGLKQIGPNPWEELEKKYVAGTRVKGKIKNITDFGIFVDIGEEFDGLVRMSDIAWDSKDKEAIKKFEKGQEIDAVVLDIDTVKQRLTLGIKQLTGDPWDSIPERYPHGRIIEGHVVKVMDFGVFVELEPSVDGLIHIIQLSSEEKSKDKVKKIGKDEYKVGDKITCVVLETDPKKKKISLSVRALKEKEERENIASFSQQQGEVKTSLGALIKQKLAANKQ